MKMHRTTGKLMKLKERQLTYQLYKYTKGNRRLIQIKDLELMKDNISKSKSTHHQYQYQEELDL